jgi:hypothetical protein
MGVQKFLTDVSVFSGVKEFRSEGVQTNVSTDVSIFSGVKE